MKKSLLALSILGAFAGVAHAQSSVTIYGNLDLGVTKSTGGVTSIGKRDNNRLGFKGVEDLGNGLKALFQLETRFDPDRGTNETGATGAQRPLFQGQSRVGLQGDFGTVRLGRGLTALQETSTYFEPWHGLGNTAGFQSDLQVAGYNSDPLSFADGSKNRFSNALFYNTPEVAGAQLNVTVATKEPIVGPTAAVPAVATVKTPFSLSGTYKNGPAAAMLAYERNAIDTTLWSVAATVVAVADLKLFASYQRAETAADVKTKAFVLGANYTMGPGKILAGYGQKRPDGVVKTKQYSLGYEYSLSPRTYLYADASNKKAVASVKTYAVGLNHAF